MVGRAARATRRMIRAHYRTVPGGLVSRVVFGADARARAARRKREPERREKDK